MTTYNTGNPIGSTDARDLYDNAQAFDEAVNSTSQTYTDRRGVQRPTLPSLQAEFPLSAANAAAAAVSAANAAAAAQTATTQVDLAATQAGLASAAKTAAESAATAALAAAKTYTTTAAGIAATTSGQVFLVSTADPQIFSVYQNSSGSAVFAGALNIADGSLINENLAVSDYALVVSDKKLNVSFGVLNDGTTKVQSLESAKVSTAELYVEQFNATELKLPDYGFQIGQDQYIFSVQDKYGRLSFAIDQSGGVMASEVNAKKLLVNGVEISQSSSNSIYLSGAFKYNIAHFLCYGQSLSLGGAATPAITKLQRFDNLKFQGGIRTQHPDDAVNYYSSLVPLTETDNPPDGYQGGETPVAGATDMIKELIASENGLSFTKHSYQLLGSAPGEGGKPISELSAGGTYFENNLRQNINNAYALSQAAGKTYGVSAFAWVQGESDNLPSGITIDQYKTKLATLTADIQAHVQNVTKQTEAVRCIVAQLCSFYTSGRSAPNIELALFEATQQNPNTYLACPMYFFDFSDGYHLQSQSSAWLGAYLGLAYKRVVVDGDANFKPLVPVSTFRQGKIVEVKFNVPKKPLTFDTDRVALNANYGFSLVDSLGASIAISSVSITQEDTVRIVADANIPTGAKLRYAFGPSAAPNRFTGPRGNLRDSQGNTLVFNPNGLNLPMHNWCPIFQLSI